jgi:cobalt-zinc-cadmium efflux system outer membrane protein
MSLRIVGAPYWYGVLLAWSLSAFAATGTTEIAEPTGGLQRYQALELALLRNPGLMASRAEVQAREGSAEQAGALPNPELEVLRENFGNDRLQGTDGPATIFALGQLLELGGKRSARRSSADAFHARAEQDYQLARATLRAEVNQAFTELLAAQARQQLARDMIALAEETHRAVSESVKAGKVSPLEEIRAGVILAGVRLDAEQTERDLMTARRRLSATWASARPLFTEAEADWEPLPELPSVDALLERLPASPELMRWTSTLAQREAEQSLARAQRIPDITLRAGIKRYEELGEDVYLVGVSIPLPLFNRNQGGVREANARFEQARHEQDSAAGRLAQQLTDSYSRLQSARTRAIGLKQDLIPAAEQVLQASREGYRYGKFKLFDVLDAQRTVYATRGQYLTALTEFHQRLADLERLLGAPLLTPNGDKK